MGVHGLFLNQILFAAYGEGTPRRVVHIPQGIDNTGVGGDIVWAAPTVTAPTRTLKSTYAMLGMFYIKTLVSHSRLTSYHDNRCYQKPCPKASLPQTYCTCTH